MSDIEGRLDCPQCGERLREVQEKVYPTNPASRYTFCAAEACDFEGARTLGADRRLIDIPSEPEEPDEE